MINISTKSQASIVASVEVSTESVAGAYTDGAETNGSYHTIKTRTVTAGRLEYVVTTNADDVENLNPDSLDLTEWPRVKQVDGYVSSRGILRFSLDGVKTTRAFDIGNYGTTQTETVSTGLLSGTMLKFFHDLAYGAATTGSKTDFYYRTVSGSTPSAVTNGNHQVIEINPTCWASGWDFSGVPIWSSNTNSPAKGGCMITSRHLVEAYHYARPVGTVFRFMTPTGEIIERTSIGVNRRSSSADYLTALEEDSIPGDINVHVLNSAVPAGVKVYSVAGPWSFVLSSTGVPSSIYPWQTPISGYSPLVGIYLDQQRKAWFLGSYNVDCFSGGGVSVSSVSYQGVNVSVACQGAGMTGVPIGTPLADLINGTPRHRVGNYGDSGSAVFLPVSSSEMVLAFCFTLPGNGSRPEQARMNALIASADANAGVTTGLTVTVATDPTPT